MKKIIIITVLLLMNVASVYAAVGCTLNDPDRDIRRIFPAASNYKTDFFTIKDKGGEALAQQIEAQLGDQLLPPYETLDVPYAYYTVLNRKEVIGYVHGVNQKGIFGGLQLILATNTEGAIIDFYYQKLTSPEAKNFRNKDFTQQFIGLTLSDFLNDSHGRLAAIQSPSDSETKDFTATLRGLKKNMILLNEFIHVKE